MNAQMYRSTIIYLFFVVLGGASTYAQISIPPQVVTVNVRSDQGKVLNNASVTFRPLYAGTTISILGTHVRGGEYRVALSPGSGISHYSYEVSAPDHETRMGSYVVGQSLTLNVPALLYNNYSAHYKVTSGNLIDVFGTTEIQLDQSDPRQPSSQASPLYFKFHLPFPSEDLYTDGRYPKWHYISNYQYREGLYHDLLKELVLQSSALKSSFADDATKEWIKSNYRVLGGKNLNELSDFGNELTKVFGKTLLRGFQPLATALHGVTLVYSMQRAADEGLLQALLTVAAYKQAQADAFDLLKEKASQSTLFTDAAFRSALDRLERTLEEERGQDAADIARKVREKAVFGVIGKEVTKAALSKALVLSLGISTGSGFLVVYIAGQGIWAILDGEAKAAEMQSSMLILAEIDHAMFSREIGGSVVGLTDLKVASSDAFYGGMMRLHGAYLLNELRGDYYSGRGKGFVVGFLDQLKSNGYKRKIAEESGKKSSLAHVAYLRLSAKWPYERAQQDWTAARLVLGLILDSSGSMTQNDPQNSRKTAASLILDQLSGKEKLFLVDFDDNSVWLNPDNWQSWDKGQARVAIEGINSDGGTNIGGGLAEMRRAMEGNVTESDRAGVLLLTDGLGSYNQEAAWFQEKQIPVYTISFVGEDNAKLLSDIAGLTGGQYIKCSSPAEIISAFNLFFTSLSGKSTYFAYQGSIAQDEKQEQSFLIDPGASHFFASLTWPGSKIALELVSPKGRKFGEGSTSEWFASDKYVAVKVASPESGTWKARFVGVEIPAGPEQFNFEVNGDSPERVTIKDRSFKGGPVTFELSSDEGSVQALKNVAISASVVTPKNATVDISRSIREGTLIYHPLEGPGSYRFAIDVRANLDDSSSLQRHFSRTVLVGDYVPTFIGPVKILMGAYLKAAVGKRASNRPGVKCYVFPNDGRREDRLAVGYVTSVLEDECIVELQQFLSSRKPSVGDFLELDIKDWQNDAPR